MCIDYEYELVWNLKCEECGTKPAVDLRDPTGEEWPGEPKALCEKCGIAMYGEGIVSDWAGTTLYQKRYACSSS